MSIKNKFSLVLITLISTVLLCSYSIIYILFSQNMVAEVINYQESIVSLNKNLITSFMDSIEHTSLMLISNQTLGTYLSSTSNDPLTRIQTRSAILKQFSQYSTSQIPNNLNYFYKNTLFLNDRLPITSAFDAKSLDTNSYTRSYNVFSNASIKYSDWYRKTLSSLRNHYVFINQDTQEFCFAKKIKNTFYVGPYDPDGVGVMVVSIKLDQLENILTFSPLTPNSSYCLISKSGDILYKSNDSINSSIFKELYRNTPSNQFNTKQSIITEIASSQYVVNTSNLDWDMSLLFLTPYSDITHHVSSFMFTFLEFALVVFCIVPFIAYFIAYRLTKPIITLSEAIKGIEDTRTFDTNKLDLSTSKELKTLCRSFKQLIVYVNNLIEDITLQSKKQKDSELRALQAQINPHFIFNAMDVVNWIALSRNQDDIATIVGSISNLMRYSITNPNTFTKISDEIENIYEFISIYQLRHEYPIIMTVDSLLALDKLFIPKFIIQPLVENTIKHGINPLIPASSLNIFIHIFQKDASLHIEISSTGERCDPNKLNDFLKHLPSDLNPSSGLGIRNVNERIQLHFKEDSGLSYFIDGKGALTAQIIIKDKVTKNITT